MLAKLEESPFYAEGGGQVADTGRVAWDGGSARVTDVYRLGDDQALKLGGAEGSPPEAGAHVEAEVDRAARHATMRNHTATHLLHAALRERLGTHVRQAGSAVRPDKLRFDFTHGAPLTPEEVRDVGDMVNEWIKGEPPRPRDADVARRGREARSDGALRREVRRVGAGRRGRRGLARALRRDPRRQHGRGRDLHDRDRGLERGERAPHRGPDRPCGDRLVPRALAGAGRGRQPARLRAGPGRGARRAGERLAELERTAKEAGAADVSKQADEIVAAGERIGEITVFVGATHEADQRTLLDLADRIKQRAGDSAVVLGGANDGKVALVASFSDAAIAKGLSAAAVIKEAAQLVGGGGGGRDNVAQAGGKDPERLDDALAVAKEAIESKLGMRVMALDYGSARCGCAISDPTGTLATPLSAFSPPEIDEIAEGRPRQRGRPRYRRFARRTERGRGRAGPPDPGLRKRTGGASPSAGRDL